jgi:hypothetical protein
MSMDYPAEQIPRGSQGMGGIGEGEQMQGQVVHPLFGQDLRFTAQVVPDDPDEQVRQTIALMTQYAQEDSQSPAVQADIAQICRSGGNQLGLITKAWEWTQRKIQFIRDEELGGPLEQLLSQYNGYRDKPVVEVLIRPRDMAGIGVIKAGDCDDYSMYLSALLTGMGIRNSFVTIAGDMRDPGHFSHVYVAAYPDDQNVGRVSVDASHGEYCGWEGRKPGARIKEWKVNW